MRRALTALALTILVLSCIGCFSASDATLTAAKGNTRDLRTIRKQVIPMLPVGEVPVGTETWTIRGLWDNRIATMIVRSRSIEAGITGDKAFDTTTAAGEEGVTKEPR